MKRRIWKHFNLYLSTGVLLLTGLLFIVSCKDEYLYDNSEPDWLGASIYDYLKSGEKHNTSG